MGVVAPRPHPNLGVAILRGPLLKLLEITTAAIYETDLTHAEMPTVAFGIQKATDQA